MSAYTGSKTILHLIETRGPGGAENVFLALANGINKNRYRSIACLRATGWVHEQLTKQGISTYLISDRGMLDPGFVGALVRLCRRENVALIQCHEFLMNFYGSVAGFLCRIPVVTTVHGRYYYWEKARRRWAMRFAARRSQMITVSEELRGFLVQKVGIPDERLKTIYNGIDLGKHCRAVSRGPGPAGLGPDAQPQVVGTVGNLYPVKGQAYLLQAIPSILKEFPHAIFAFAGRGDLEETLKRQAVDFGIEAHVRFLGFVEDVPALLDTFDVFVLPSLAEVFPLSVLEAMAHGVPPVVTDVGGNREIMEDGVSGYIVPPADPSALAEKIALLLRNRELARGMAEKAHETVRNRFSLEAMLSGYERLYDSLTGDAHCR